MDRIHWNTGTKYPISYWCGPPEATEDRYAELAAAGFTVAAPPVANGSVEYNRKMLDLCRQFGLSCIVGDRRMNEALEGTGDPTALLEAIVRDYADHPAFGAYHVMDEPGSSRFPRLATISRILEKADPDHPAYINLFPNYASPQQLENDTYEQHLEQFLTVVRPSLLSYDHYHFMKEDDTTRMTSDASDARGLYEAAIARENRPGFQANIVAARDAALRHGVPFMVIVLLVEHGRYRNLTEPEIRWEVFQSLAYGSSAISYFTYWTPYDSDDDLWQWKNGCLTVEGERTPHYEMVQRVNRDLQRIGSRLIGHGSLRVMTVAAGPAETLPDFEIQADSPLTAGIFEDGLVLLANQDYLSQAKVSIGPRVGKVVETLDGDGQWQILRSSIGFPGCLHLEAGDAVLVRTLPSQRAAAP
jgi:hypothetical protein